MQIVTHVLTSPQSELRADTEEASARRKAARQNIGAVAGAKVGETPVSTDSDGFIVLPDASLQGKGIVKLVDSIDTEERFVAVTPKAVQDAMAQVGGYKVVEAGSDGKPNVPIEERSPNYIYLTEDPDAQGEDHYNEWIWDLGDPSADPLVAASWKLIGTTSPDLRDYVHKVSGGTSGNLATLTNDGSIEDSTIAGTDVADAVAKKHIHSNQDTLDDITAAYTAAEQTKLTGIAEGAQVNKIESISANSTALRIDADKNVDIPLATANSDGLLPKEKFPLIPVAPVAGADRIYSFDDDTGTSWQTIVKEYVGNMILDQQGTPVTDEEDEIMYEEEAVPLWLSYKGVEFGARRAYDDHTGANIHDSIASRTTMAQVTTAIETALANYGGFVVVSLTSDDPPVPDVAEPSTRFIYLTKETPSTKEDPYTEWIWVEPDGGVAHWEKIGETSIDVDNFAHKVTGGTPGNIPALDQNGDLVDSGVSASAVSTAVQDVKIGNSSLKDASNVATIPMFTSTTDGVVTAPTAANRNHYSFLDGMGDWSMLEEVSESDIDGMFLTVTIGGRDYKVVQIGNQLWMAENLDWKWDGLPIGVNDRSSEEQRASYYDNNESTYGVNGNKYGLLYNVPAITYLESNKSTMLPNGWHVPTISDFNTLFTSIGSNGGTKLKSTTGWNSGNGTDDYGFSAFPTGLYEYGSFKDVGTYTLFSSSETSPGTYNQRGYYCNTGSNVTAYGYSTEFRVSIRLVKNLT